MLSKRIGLIAVTAMLLAPVASDGADRPSKGIGCKSLSNDLLKSAMTPQSKVEAVDGKCLFSHVRIKTGLHQSWTVDQLSVEGLDDWNQKLSPLPPHVRVEATAIRFAPDIGNSHARYLMGLTAKPFNARLDFALDIAANRLSVREVVLESPWLGHVSVGIDAEFPQAPPEKPSDMFGLQIANVRFVLDNRVVLESMIMPSIIALIPDDKDPAVEFPRKQKEAERRWKKLSNAVLDEESRDALVRFTRDFPHPSGHFEFDMRFERPMPFERISKAGKDEKWLDSAKIHARYQPQAAPIP